MKNSIETAVKIRGEREHIQERTTLLIARLTAQSGRLLFVSDEVLAKRLGISTRKSKSPTYRIRDAFRKLQAKGLLEYKQGPRGWSAHLTEAGRKHAKVLDRQETIKIQKPKRWDGRWRVVIFDIWERRRSTRDRLRRMLKRAGFYKVQNSVWVHPYDCEELISFLKVHMRLGNGVLYMIADGIEHDAGLRKHFDLP